MCQRLSSAPSRFRASLPEVDTVFNRVLCCDLMKIDKSMLLHCVDKDTKFNAAEFLQNESAEDVWESYQRIWALRYIGHPDVLHADAGSQFGSRIFRTQCKLASIYLKLSGVESRNSIGVGERYHKFLRQISKKVKSEIPTMDKKDILNSAIKVLNDTAGPHGLVPTLLVFEVMPRTPVTPLNLPDQIKRMEAMEKARSELSAITADDKVKRAPLSTVPTAASSDIKIGMEALVYREGPKVWDGPFIVLDVCRKVVHLNINGRSVKFSIDKVKQYRRSTVVSNPPIQQGDSRDHTESQQTAPLTERIDQIMCDIRRDSMESRRNIDVPLEISEFIT